MRSDAPYSFSKPCELLVPLEAWVEEGSLSIRENILEPNERLLDAAFN